MQQAKLKIEGLETELADTAADLVLMKASLTKEKDKSKRLWQKQREQHMVHEDEMNKKDAEIERLKVEVAGSQCPGEPFMRQSSPMTCSGSIADIQPTMPTRVGKAPLVNPHTGEDPEVWWEDCMATDI